MDFLNVYKNLEEKAAQNIKRENDDYIVDGLLYCGKCRTQKQTRVSLFGETRTPMCLCKCAVEQREKENEERRKQEQMRKIDRMRAVGFPDTEMQQWNFEKDDHSNEWIINVAKKYVDNFPRMYKQGKGLLLFGNVGTGKTFSAACIANALIDKGRPCLVTNFARLVNTLQGINNDKQAYLDSLHDYDLLVIDDLASERDTEYMGEIIQNIIDSRYRAKLPVIITTNLTPQELKNPADMRKQRIYSRLFEMCIPIEVKGVDRRREKLKQDYKEYDELLGLKSDGSQHEG